MEPFKRFETAKGPSLFLLPEWMEISEGLTVGFTGREGGESTTPWESLNCGLHVGDENAAVLDNRRRLAEALQWPYEAWTCGEQVHGNRVYQVKREDRGRGRLDRESAIQEADALMTAEKDVLLTSFYADCVPLYFYDPAEEVIALAHAGWKGTALEIAHHTVEAMSEAYGCLPANIRGGIGPSIGQCCYEVDGVVLSKIEPLVRELDELMQTRGLAGEQVVLPASEGKARINLKELNRQIMIKAGILPTRIELSEWCTGCRTDLFFSHRMEGGQTGRMVSWIGMGRGEALA
ncbi:peptidoglycan editing factor PgeF [Paenibacillus mendelii]|uniref:Purine nucleoside phosphorylase n=1 Tax=Paenibacillus mendelii TaxID=206163 RepID=A0ABV6JHL3_9BACL|nr:peptidoglycan editing factor PgeF [Paenibacillus mendelii]MCQ6558254.1 peptidoglycan editing factor PgeF [Paenibacillus mendelii]